MTVIMFILIIVIGAISFWYSLDYTRNFSEETLSFFFHFAAEAFLMYLIGVF